MAREGLPIAFDFATWTRLIPESEIRRLLRIRVRYYFAGGKPGVLPIRVFPRLLAELGLEEMDLVLRGEERNVVEHFNYGPSEGLPELRELLARKMLRARDGLQIDPEEGWKDVIITTGSQQAIYAILDSLIDPGDVIITQRPAYLGFVNVAAKFQARVVTVPADEKGMVPEYVDRAAELVERDFGVKPKLVYAVPDSDNPTGTTMPESRRKAFFDLVSSRGMYLFEDAAYREIQFRGEPVKPIKAFDKNNEFVIYQRSTSKEVAVFRIGYSYMPPRLKEQVIKAKGYIDLCTPTLMQKLAVMYYEKYFDEHILRVREGYRERCEAMEESIDESFPPGHRTSPTGGFFIWWSSDHREFDSGRFLNEVALKNDVSFVPGAAFYPPSGYSYEPETDKLEPLKPRTHGMRLGYSYLTPQEIREGITRLGRLLRKYLPG